MAEDFWGLYIKNGVNCTQPAIDDFPKDLFTETERLQGAFVLHIVASLYLFVALALVCDKYFVPAVEKICGALNMSNDVAGATFMAAATSAPELFVNVIGTFITEGDIGVGTIVGSAVFNILAVAACCGLAAGMVVPLDWWPVTRDCVAYGVTVAILIVIIHDERVEWYEALVLVSLYVVYIAIMMYDKSIKKCVIGSIENMNQAKIEKKLKKQNIAGGASELAQENGNVKKNELQLSVIEVSNSSDKVDLESSSEVAKKEDDETSQKNAPFTLTKYPSEQSFLRQILWIVTWPIYFIFFITIPDCEKPRYKRLFPLTFIMCIVWIGSLSYLVAWMITIIGHTLRIPDSVMGITFLAAGTSVPEAVSSVIVAKQGHGSMGISNSIGSNTFDILLCLGLPWLIKAAFLPIKEGHHYVEINSAGLEYSAISLLSTLLMLYVAFKWNKFKLDRKVGFACLLMYGVFLVLASLIELNVFFLVNLPTCGR